jgi:hypothetical protein
MASFDMDKYREDSNSLSKKKAFWDSEQHTNEDNVLLEIIGTCYDFRGKPVLKSKKNYKNSNPLNKLKRSLRIWKDVLKNAVLK